MKSLCIFKLLMLVLIVPGFFLIDANDKKRQEEFNIKEARLRAAVTSATFAIWKNLDSSQTSSNLFQKLVLKQEERAAKRDLKKAVTATGCDLFEIALALAVAQARGVPENMAEENFEIAISKCRLSKNL